MRNDIGRSITDSMKKQKRLNMLAYVFVAALVILIAVQIFVLKADNKKPADPLAVLWSGNYVEDKEFWKGRMEEIGTEKAYEEFKADTQGKNFGISHTLAHIIGELIYEKEGLEGVAFCDSSFSFGCYHSFFGKAISVNGIGVIYDLDKACIRKWGEKGLGCPHGIGHGVQGYFGDDRLDESLELCTKLNWKEPIGGCTSGVFMEFNFHTMQNLEGKNRELDPQNPHHPCNAVSSKFTQACYFEQPQWWAQVFSWDYTKMGLMCAEVKDTLSREACFRGMGNNIAPYTKYDPVATIATCALMPGTEEELLCREGASWSFYSEPSVRDRVGEVCVGLGEERQKRCFVGFDIVGDKI